MQNLEGQISFEWIRQEILLTAKEFIEKHCNTFSLSRKKKREGTSLHKNLKTLSVVGANERVPLLFLVASSLQIFISEMLFLFLSLKVQLLLLVIMILILAIKLALRVLRGFMCNGRFYKSFKHDYRLKTFQTKKMCLSMFLENSQTLSVILKVIDLSTHTKRISEWRLYFRNLIKVLKISVIYKYHLVEFSVNTLGVFTNTFTNP